MHDIDKFPSRICPTGTQRHRGSWPNGMRHHIVAKNVRFSKDIVTFGSSTNLGDSGSNVLDGREEDDRQSIWLSHCPKDGGVKCRIKGVNGS